MKINLIGILLILLLTSASIFTVYYKNTQQQILTLEQARITLEVAVQQQQAAIRQRELEMEAQKQQMQAQNDMQERQHKAELDAQLAQQRLEYERWKAQLDSDTQIAVARMRLMNNGNNDGMDTDNGVA